MRLILFDGVCNFCGFWVRFLIRRDPEKRFRFASLQSATGREILQKVGLPVGELNTMIYAEDSRTYLGSAAVLRVARAMHGLWPLLYLFIAVPAPLRDLVYRWVARHRYRWFGKRDSCLVPSADLQDRFLD